MFWTNQSPSSSEDERYDAGSRGERRSTGTTSCRTPLFSRIKETSSCTSTPLTVTQMTPSPVKSPLISDYSHIRSNSFSAVQGGYLENIPTFYYSTPTKRRRKRSSRRSRLSDSLLLEDNITAKPPLGMSSRRRSSFREKRGSPQTSDTSPETSPSVERRTDSSSRTLSSGRPPPEQQNKKISHSWFLKMTFLCMLLLSMAGMVLLIDSAVPSDPVYDFVRPEVHISDSGLRGKMVQGHWDGMKNEKKQSNKSAVNEKDYRHKKVAAPSSQKQHSEHHSDVHHHKTDIKKSTTKKKRDNHDVGTVGQRFPKVQLPTASFEQKQQFDTVDKALYKKTASKKRRVVMFDPSLPMPHHRKIKLYPADFTDNTQFYSVLDSDDERLNRMERRAPYSTDECVPMQDWQTTYHPLCNEMHDLSMPDLGEKDGFNFNLFGTKGFWRNAWKVESEEHDTVVLKTLKFEHNFEDAHYEHDRVDAIAMERLTSSEHVINIFGFCGHSVMTEYADGTRLGALADKAKKKPLERLKIARDISNGLADVHGIDGDGDASFVHLDINPANVVSIGGTLKLNDFNIGIIRQWNVTSNRPCGFPAQYPNPQWRSPEEARNEQHLTEKVDIFSMGHIFFRLICGHEPWNKLEPGGRPSREEVNEKVKKGILPFIPDSIKNSDDPEIIAIRDVMLACYRLDPSKRPSAREISNILDKALRKLAQNSSSK